MVSISLKDITSMKSTVVIHQQDITRFHGESGNVFFRSSLNFLTIFQTQGFHGVRIKDFGHTDLGDTTGSSITKFSGVVVGIVEPDRKTSHRVTVDGGFRGFHSLETSGLTIGFVNHFKVHVELRCDSRIDRTFDTFLQNTGEGRRDVKIGHGDTDLTVVQLLQDFGVKFGKDGSTIGNKETSTTLCGLLETHKGSIGSRTLGSRFGV
mmetsp:Transcript_15374/g.18481  ORF Transcript_15374/g.18481 Transcript_15374/m.18481 type:complete len:208 (+) Transcript_15374:331-954(+)